MKTTLRNITLLIAAITIVSGCKNESTAPPTDEHGAPTTLIVVAKRLDASGSETSDSVVVTLRDTTVVKNKPAIEGQLKLAEQTTYNISLQLWNESATPAVNITKEIEDERDFHQFVITPKGNLIGNMTTDNFDKDSKGKDVGLKFRLATKQSASGTFNVVLRHYDNGDKSSALFDTDIDRDVPVTVE